MRVRKVDGDGDMRFGANQNDYWRDVPDGVGQVVASRLNLWAGEWYLDRAEGTPYATQVLGKRTESLRDPAIRTRILQTPGVTGIAAYTSVLDRATRGLRIDASVETAYASQTPSGLTTTAPVNQTIYEYR